MAVKLALKPFVLAVIVALPGAAASVKVVLDIPLVVVAFEALESEPLPLVIAHVTVESNTAFPLESLTVTVNGVRADPAAAV